MFSAAWKYVCKRHSKEKCAANIRIAQAAVQRYQKLSCSCIWLGHLEKNGYKKIVGHLIVLKKGIFIIERTSGHTYGHIAGYTGVTAGFSDFRQKPMRSIKKKDVKYSVIAFDSMKYDTLYRASFLSLSNLVSGTAQKHWKVKVKHHIRVFIIKPCGANSESKTLVPILKNFS